MSDKQWHFLKMTALLFQYAEFLGYKLTYGQAYRKPTTAERFGVLGIGISNSLHTERLAIDLNLFINDEYRKDTEAHRPLGEFWEFLGGTWGGRFKDKNGNPKPDGNHYSLAHNGVK